VPVAGHYRATGRACEDDSVIRYVITSPLSLARLLWWYGEDDLWPRALGLSPAVVAFLAEEFASLRARPEDVYRLWPSPPFDAYLLLPTIAQLEGEPRPAARRHRRAREQMPLALDVEEEKRWRDPQLEEVARIVDLMSGAPERHDDPADRPRLRGRWAPW
jgi:hypothetical protein